MRILIVVPEQDRISGNWVTAMRFQQGLSAHGQQVIVEETGLQPEPRLLERIQSFAPDVTILLHAYRAGKPWLQATADRRLPTVVLLTGTDINHGLENPQQQDVIKTILGQAELVLLQNPLLAKALSSNHPELSVNLRELPPGIRLGTEAYHLRDKHQLAKEATLFLCPAGLRSVKGPLELLELFDQVVTHSSDVLLAFCGPAIEEEYSQRFLSALKTRPWAHYLGAIPTQAMASAMCEADVVVNNSQTEGLANSLLEAATLGIPILAHKIPGNSAVVEHETNGLLYNSREDFLDYSTQLLDRERRQQLSSPEPDRYDPDKEALALLSFLQQAVPRAQQ
jgi:glycosyltransferase involved in cell wall biosynthesis